MFYRSKGRGVSEAEGFDLWDSITLLSIMVKVILDVDFALVHFEVEGIMLEGAGAGDGSEDIRDNDFLFINVEMKGIQGDTFFLRGENSAEKLC